MALLTLAQAQTLSLPQMQSGIIDEIVTVNQMAQLLPFNTVNGQVYTYNRELTQAQAAFMPVNATFTTSTATFQTISRSLTTLGGQTGVDGLIQSTMSNVNNQEDAQIASLAKNVGQTFWTQFATGDGTLNGIEGLPTLCPASNKISMGVNGGPLTLGMMDELMFSVKDKGGALDYFVMNGRMVQEYRKLARAASGAGLLETISMPDGSQVNQYCGIPIFRNEYLTQTETVGTSTACSQIFGGTFDDGSAKHGISGLTSEKDFGVIYQSLGLSQTVNSKLHRVIWYVGTALYSTLGLYALDGVTTTP